MATDTTKPMIPNESQFVIYRPHRQKGFKGWRNMNMQPHLNTVIILSVDARFQEEVLQRGRAKRAVQHYYTEGSSTGCSALTEEPGFQISEDMAGRL